MKTTHYLLFSLLLLCCCYSGTKTEIPHRALPFGSGCFLEARTGGAIFSVPAPQRPGACVNFNISYSSFGGVPQDAQDAIEYAADIWGGLLSSSQTINVTVVWFPLPGTTLGVGLANGVQNFSGANRQNTWYPVAMANAILGQDLKPGEDDMTIYLSSTSNWYTGIDAKPGNNQQDLVSVALHEFGHGLGFTSLANYDAISRAGSFGIIDSADFPPSSFPFPELDTLPSGLDAFLVHGSGARLVDEINPSTALGILQTSNDISMNAPTAKTAYNGVNPPMHAPSVFALGTSLSHLADATFANDTVNGLMSPFSTSGTAIHNPGPIVLGLMEDLGWPRCNSTSIREKLTWNHRPTVLYTPDNQALISFSSKKAIPLNLHIYALDGTNILNKKLPPSTQEQRIPLDLTSFSSGLYVFQIDGGGLSASGKIVVR
ncbi:MAG: hypothetical protein AB8F95_20405 [Bacteroidia bacterium]